jgi:flavin-dependent dehydrogenase
MQNGKLDVVVVGASLAGCAAAINIARRGGRVFLVERESEPDAYKSLCTHSIHSSATPAIERLGLTEAIEAAGGVRIKLEIWTRWGWIRDRWVPKDRPAYGYNMRREKLDPMLRSFAAATPGVEFLPAHTLRDLIVDGGRPAGVKLRRHDGADREIRCQLVVGADGRNSHVARFANFRQKITPNERFAYYAQYRNVDLKGTCQTWFLDPDWAGAFATDDGVIIAGVMLPRHKLAAWKRDLWGNLESFFTRLPDAPELTAGMRASPMMGVLELPCVSRPASRPGVALVGDATLAADPLWGVGCGFAFESAEWLADSIADALEGKGDLDKGLERYARRHRKALGGHAHLMADYAKCRPFNVFEKLMYSAAARDAKCAANLLSFGTRNIRPTKFLAPPALLRSLGVNLAHMAVGT